MATLSQKIGEMNYDGLISDVTPKTQIRGVVIRKLSTAATLKRGTIMAKSSTDSKLVILGTTAASGETLTPDCILTDDIAVGTSVDATTTAYTAGCFDSGKVAVKSGYTIKATDFDALRKYGIVFKAANN